MGFQSAPLEILMSGQCGPYSEDSGHHGSFWAVLGSEWCLKRDTTLTAPRRMPRAGGEDVAGGQQKAAMASWSLLLEARGRLGWWGKAGGAAC